MTPGPQTHAPLHGQRHDLPHEAREQTNPQNRVDDGKRLRKIRAGGEIAKANRGNRHQAEIERIQRIPLLHLPLEHRPAGQRENHRTRYGAEIRIVPHSLGEGPYEQHNVEEQQEQGAPPKSALAQRWRQ